MKRIAITGGAGFLGSHLADLELAAGNVVTVVDNLFTGSRSNLLEAEKTAAARFEFLRADVCDPLHLEVDWIYHAACPAAPLHYSRNPARTIETGVVGTLNVLRWAREVGARVLLFSTSEIYGNPTVHPQPETYRGNVNTLGDRSCYDEGKRASESLAAAYYQQYSVDVRIVRIFNTYGPRMAVGDGRVIPSFLEALRAGRPLELHGGGGQTRSFCYVSDLVRGLSSYMRWDEKLKTVPVLNLGNPHEVTIRQVAESMAALLSRPLLADASAANPIGDDPERRCPDITRAKAWLGWSPAVNLEDGLRRTLEAAGLLHGSA